MGKIDRVSTVSPIVTGTRVIVSTFPRPFRKNKWSERVCIRLRYLKANLKIRKSNYPSETRAISCFKRLPILKFEHSPGGLKTLTEKLGTDSRLKLLPLHHSPFTSLTLTPLKVFMLLFRFRPYHPVFKSGHNLSAPPEQFCVKRPGVG